MIPTKDGYDFTNIKETHDWVQSADVQGNEIVTCAWANVQMWVKWGVEWTLLKVIPKKNNKDVNIEVKSNKEGKAYQSCWLQAQVMKRK